MRLHCAILQVIDHMDHAFYLMYLRKIVLKVMQGLVAQRITGWEQLAEAHEDVDRWRGGDVTDDINILDEDDQYAWESELSALGLHACLSPHTTIEHPGPTDDDGCEDDDTINKGQAVPSSSSTPAEPLYDRAPVTADQASYGFAKLKADHGLTNAAMEDILKWVNFILPQPNKLAPCAPAITRLRFMPLLCKLG